MLVSRLHKPVIKVITGIRRAGKSTIVRHFLSSLKKEYCTIYIDKEDMAFDAIKDYTLLYDYIIEHQSKTKRNVIIVDEIQYIHDWQKAIISLAAKQEIYDIYITGSNSTLLSGELATMLAGRYITIHVLPLSFSEFIQYQGHKGSTQRSLFIQYLQQWWLPWLLVLEDNKVQQQDYLIWLKNTIIIKDIVDRFAVRNVAQFQNVLTFLADNIGNLFSAKKIADYLKSQHINLTVTTLQDYLYYTATTYLTYKVPRYDIKGKRILEIQEKRYFGDIWLRNSLVWRKENDIWYILENIVYLELLKRGYQVYVGVFWQKEIDFVATKPWGVVEYVQVCYLLKDTETKEREFGNLLSIKDNYPKMVITMDDTPASSYQGIQKVHIIDRLLS